MLAQEHCYIDSRVLYKKRSPASRSHHVQGHPGKNCLTGMWLAMAEAMNCPRRPPRRAGVYSPRFLASIRDHVFRLRTPMNGSLIDQRGAPPPPPPQAPRGVRRDPKRATPPKTLRHSGGSRAQTEGPPRRGGGPRPRCWDGTQEPTVGTVRCPKTPRPRPRCCQNTEVGVKRSGLHWRPSLGDLAWRPWGSSELSVGMLWRIVQDVFGPQFV